MHAPLEFTLSGVPPLENRLCLTEAERKQRLKGRIYLIFAKPGIMTRVASANWEKSLGLSEKDQLERNSKKQDVPKMFEANVTDPNTPQDRILAWSFYPVFEAGEDFLLFRTKEYYWEYLRKKVTVRKSRRIHFAYRSPEAPTEAHELLLTNT